MYTYYIFFSMENLRTYAIFLLKQLRQTVTSTLRKHPYIHATQCVNSVSVALVYLGAFSSVSNR